VAKENTQATQEPAAKPGPPAGPRIRFTRESQPFQIGTITNRFPYDSCVRLINERTAEVVDEAEFAQYAAAFKRKQDEANAALAEKLRKEREYREQIDRNIANSKDRMIRPGDAVTR
jgi:hypothetical protein